MADRSEGNAAKARAAKESAAEILELRVPETQWLSPCPDRAGLGCEPLLGIDETPRGRRFRSARGNGSAAADCLPTNCIAFLRIVECTGFTLLGADARHDFLHAAAVSRPPRGGALQRAPEYCSADGPYDAPFPTDEA